MYEPGEPDLDVEVRGYQWKWQYTYLNDDPSKEIQFMSALRTPQDEIQNRAGKGEHYLLDVDNPLVVPVNKRIRFLITSNDVIHSFWVPDFAVKKTPFQGLFTRVGQSSRNQEYIGANVQNCAARITDSCLSWSTLWSKKITISGY